MFKGQVIKCLNMLIVSGLRSEVLRYLPLEESKKFVIWVEWSFIFYLQEPPDFLFRARPSQKLYPSP